MTSRRPWHRIPIAQIPGPGDYSPPDPSPADLAGPWWDRANRELREDQLDSEYDAANGSHPCDGYRHRPAIDSGGGVWCLDCHADLDNDHTGGTDDQ